MEWIKNFDLFLFDFDGLLVDTEPLHYRAFKLMLEKQGFSIELTFFEYLKFAHANAIDLRDYVYATFPELYQRKPNWEELRLEKTKIYLSLLKEEKIALMPGVARLLTLLENQKIKRAVVTNATEEQTQIVKSQHNLLENIPLWICRDQCRFPKPDPEGYLKAIEVLSKEGDRIVGFEDSFKGLDALKKTSATPVLISSRHDIPKKGIIHFHSFELLNL